MEDCVEKIISDQCDETSDLLEKLERLKRHLELFDGEEVKGYCPVMDGILDALS